MISYYITTSSGAPTMIELGWNDKKLILDFGICRDHAEQVGWLPYGDWLMDNKWWAVVNIREGDVGGEQVRIMGIAFGERCWAFEWRWFKKMRKPEATA